VLLIERSFKAEHKVCGEFLSREALHYLSRLGVDVGALGGATIDCVRLASGDVVTETRLPFRAMSITRLQLDDELLQRAEDAGVRVLRGLRVDAIERTTSGWRVFADGNCISSETVFHATGKHDVRGLPRPKGKQSEMVAYKMYWRLAPPQTDALRGHVELMMYAGGYAGLQMIEGGVANLCCLVEREELRRLGGQWSFLLAAMKKQVGLLRQRLDGAEPMLEKPLAVSSIPYGFVRSSTEGLWYLGDQAAVIPSFTGDGMSIALHGALLAAEMYLNNETADAFQRRLYDEVSRQVMISTVLSRAMVWRPSRLILSKTAALWPGVLRLVAEQTRISNIA
jgi:flavin-dependent dehydrogenase